MKISNQKLMHTYRGILLFSTLIIIIGACGLNVLLTVDIGQWLVLLCSILFFLFHFAVRQIFEYDSSGEVLIFKNKTIFSMNSREFADEFPKYLLDSYKIQESLFDRKLFIKVKGEKRTSLLQYNISFLGDEKLKRLKLDLEGLLRQKYQ